jgi:hypothetical protein
LSTIAALAAVVGIALALPAAGLASDRPVIGTGPAEQAAPRPGESCSDATPPPGASDVCVDVTGPETPGSSGIDLAILLPVLGLIVAGGAVASVAAFFVLRRRASVPFVPAEPGEWWTCRSCGSTNVVGSPRCYACGTWQA